MEGGKNFIGEAQEQLSLTSKGLLSYGKVKGKSLKEWYLPDVSKDVSPGIPSPASAQEGWVLGMGACCCRCKQASVFWAGSSICPRVDEFRSQDSRKEIKHISTSNKY